MDDANIHGNPDDLKSMPLSDFILTWAVIGCFDPNFPTLPIVNNVLVQRTRPAIVVWTLGVRRSRDGRRLMAGTNKGLNYFASLFRVALFRPLFRRFISSLYFVVYFVRFISSVPSPVLRPVPSSRPLRPSSLYFVLYFVSFISSPLFRLSVTAASRAQPGTDLKLFSMAPRACNRLAAQFLPCAAQLPSRCSTHC
jgi:hypothetical protein